MFITIDLWKHIISYIDANKKQYNTNGIMICGSLPNNLYKAESDIDILFLNDSIDFSMICEKQEEYVYDQMFAKHNILNEILDEETELANILSLSFGQNQLIIDDSNELRNLIDKAKTNIEKRKLAYVRTEKKDAHILNTEFNIQKIENSYRLMKDDKIMNLPELIGVAVKPKYH